MPSRVARCHPPQTHLADTKRKRLLGKIHLRALLRLSKEEDRKLVWFA